MATPNQLMVPFVNDIGQTLEVGCDVVTFTGDYRACAIKAGKFAGVKMGTNPYSSKPKIEVQGLYIEREGERNSLIGNCRAYLPNTPLSALVGKRV